MEENNVLQQQQKQQPSSLPSGGVLFFWFSFLHCCDAVSCLWAGLIPGQICTTTHSTAWGNIYFRMRGILITTAAECRLDVGVTIMWTRFLGYEVLASVD